MKTSWRLRQCTNSRCQALRPRIQAHRWSEVIVSRMVETWPLGGGWRLAFLVVGSSLFLSPPSGCLSFPSMMTWAPCPHGVRTRGKKKSTNPRCHALRSRIQAHRWSAVIVSLVSPQYRGRWRLAFGLWLAVVPESTCEGFFLKHCCLFHLP